MALHRKQRSIVDAAPQYVRIATSSGRAVGYSLHETHSRAERVYGKRYEAGDRSRKISSLQLRACFVLCVLLYFGAIYFADDIASIGRAVGSEQNSQNSFVHSLRPRGRGNMRVGRAVDAKKMEASTAPPVTAVVPVDTEQQQDKQSDPPKEVLEVETQSPEVEIATAETEEEAQATEPPKQPARASKAEAVHQDEQKAVDDAPGDAIHPDDQGEYILSDQSEDAEHVHSVIVNHIKRAKTVSSELVEPSDGHDNIRGREHESHITSTAPQKYGLVTRDQPHPTAPLRNPEKGDAVPTVSPSHVKEQQHIRDNVDDKPEQLERNAKRDHKPNYENRLVEGLREGDQYPEATQSTAAPAKAKESKIEHISDI